MIHHLVDDNNEVFIIYWWGCLSVVAFFNLCFIVNLLTTESKQSRSKSTAEFDSIMKGLCVPYVVMTSWRSFFPNEYADRLCLFDNWMSSAFVGRLLATIGEICFITQVGMGVRRVNLELIQLSGGRRTLMNSVVNFLTYFLQLLCFIAQGFCIQSTLTKDHWYGGVEETLWGISHALLAPCVLYLFVQYLVFDGKRINAERIDLSQTQTFLFILLCYTVGLAIYNLHYHVPVLFNISRIETSQGKRYLTAADGLWNAFTERRCSRKFSAWKHTFDWQGIYFTAGAWFSMFMGLPPRVHIKYADNKVKDI